MQRALLLVLPLLLTGCGSETQRNKDLESGVSMRPIPVSPAEGRTATRVEEVRSWSLLDGPQDEIDVYYRIVKVEGKCFLESAPHNTLTYTTTPTECPLS